MLYKFQLLALEPASKYCTTTHVPQARPGTRYRYFNISYPVQILIQYIKSTVCSVVDPGDKNSTEPGESDFLVISKIFTSVFSM